MASKLAPHRAVLNGTLNLYTWYAVFYKENALTVLNFKVKMLL